MLALLNKNSFEPNKKPLTPLNSSICTSSRMIWGQESSTLCFQLAILSCLNISAHVADLCQSIFPPLHFPMNFYFQLKIYLESHLFGRAIHYLLVQTPPSSNLGLAQNLKLIFFSSYVAQFHSSLLY